MTSMWDYRAEVELVDRDIVGYDVEATDGSIGKIDESSYAAGQAFLVVDTGFWIFGKKRLIPAGVVQRIDDEAEKVFVTLSKDQIKQAPDFDERDRDVRDEYDVYYGPYGR
jgi:zona occludens toxin (predicted ATPase)